MIKLFKQYIPVKAIFLIITENVFMWGALLAAIQLRFYNDPFQAEEIMLGVSFAIVAVLLVVLCQLCFYYNDLYDLTVVCRRSELLIRLAQAVGVWCVLITCAYFLFPKLVLGRGVLVIMATLVLAGTWLWRESV